MEEYNGNTRKDFNIVLIHQEFFYLRALQDQSERNLFDPSLQDNVLILDDFFMYIYHVGCAINLHSIINSGLIPGGQNLSKRQTVFFPLVDPMNKEHKDLEKIELEAPRLAQFTCTQHGRNIKTRCIGSTSDLLKRKDLSSTIERNHPSRHTPS